MTKQNIASKIQEVREGIAKIIRINLELMNKNKRMCQEIADAILLYIWENER